MKFNERVKNHLSDYKLNILGVYENGVWKRNDRPYPHILPTEQLDFNLLENYREEMHHYISTENIHLHQDFHHLNSSQAVCLNFFYPLIAEKQISMLLQMLQLENEVAEVCVFEKIMSGKEGTNFDFYIKLQSGRQLFFEIKYTENEFGKVKSIGKYRRKYEEIYKKRLFGKIRPGLNEYDELINNYQLLRNISYVDASNENLLIIICPQDNSKLLQEYHDVMNRVIDPELHKSVRLITWETMLFELNKILQASNAPIKLLDHYGQFEEKYLI